MRLPDVFSRSIGANGITNDIVNRQGELARPVQLPPAHTLVGFGRDGVVYLSMRDATALKLARVRLRQDD